MSTDPRKRATASLGAAFLDLVAAFDPGVEQLQEERRRARTELVVPGDADKDWDVDLDRGEARLVAVAPAAPDADPADPDGDPADPDGETV